MQKERTPKAALLASVCPELHRTKALDHLDLVLDLNNVLCLALRADAYHTEGNTESMAEVADATFELLQSAREAIVSMGDSHAR